jgi:hypothetical protein
VAVGNTKPTNDSFSAGSLTSSLQKIVQHNKDTEAVLTIKKDMRQSHKMTPLSSDDEILDDKDPNNTDDDTIHSGALYNYSTIHLNTKSSSYPNSPHFQPHYSYILTHTF